jgi:hypothetical protein
MYLNNKMVEIHNLFNKPKKLFFTYIQNRKEYLFLIILKEKCYLLAKEKLASEYITMCNLLTIVYTTKYTHIL